MTKTKQRILGLIGAALMVFGTVFTGSSLGVDAAAPNAVIRAQEKTYAQFNTELADAMSRIGDDEVALIEVYARPFVSIGGRSVTLLGQKSGLVLDVHYEKDGETRYVTLTSDDAALADENGFIGFEYASNTHKKATEAKAAEAGVSLPDGVEPITWEPSGGDLIIKTAEARALYTQIKAGNYPDMETLLNSDVITQIDALSTYYKGVYGNTANIDTPERQALREHICAKFLSAGSARTRSIDFATGRHNYVYDGPLDKGYEMELVLGLPASGKSTRVTDPDSEAMHAFILDCDEVKELIPEFRATYGAAADAIHFESFDIMNEAMKEFTEGSLKGTNVIIPIVAGDFDDLMNSYIKPFEDAGYNVTAKFVDCEPNVSVSRNIMRELETGRIINSAVVTSFGYKPRDVYEKLAPMINAQGNPYGFEQRKSAAKDAA
ncbi:Zeta toxin [Lachnospiraceae bacterium XBB2008]|nr:Zeta toxin [Lachnospiraceae bacterium XBB2008]